MAKFKISIDSILGGIAPNFYFGKAGQFSTSIGIDPDLSLTSSGSDVKTSGILRPSSYADFTSTLLNGYVNWLMTCPQDQNVYAYISTGRLLSYSSALTAASETNIGTPTSGAGNGAAYYNNYIYLATPTDISRYGPLDNIPVLANTVWSGATLGSQAVLGNPAYPALQGITIPNHPMHVHIDNKLYVGDFETSTASTSEGRGKIHWIRTNSVTDEGDTNNGTTQNAFFLPPSYAPVDIESWGTDLVILAIPMHTAGAGATIIQGRPMLFFWDAVNAPSLAYKAVPLIDPFATALLNHNGDLYIWSGSLNNGVRVSKYLGGYKVQQVAFFEEGASPLAGCVDGMGNRIVWGAFTTYPENSVSVYALGSKDANLPIALNNIINTTGSATFATTNGPMVSALKYVQQASFIDPRMIVAWKDGASSQDFGIDKLTASSGDTAVFRSMTYNVGKPFKIDRVILKLGVAVAANMTLVPSIRTDDDGTTTTLTTINSTNYSGSQREIVLNSQVQGTTNFNLQLRWTGTAILPVVMPIIIEGELLEHATQ